jgi:hypothetical protein
MLLSVSSKALETHSMSIKKYASEKTLFAKSGCCYLVKKLKKVIKKYVFGVYHHRYLPGFEHTSE